MPSGSPKTVIDVLLTSGEEEAYPLLPGSREIDLPKGSLFSILGLDTLTGLSIAGARYPLDGFSSAVRLLAHHFQCRRRHRPLHPFLRPGDHSCPSL